MKTTGRIAALAAISVLVLAGCGDRPDDDNDNGSSDQASESSEPTESNPDFKACMVSDSGGFDDKSFNQTSYKGLTDAVDQLGIEKAELESQTDSDYPDNLKAMVGEDCNAIVTVGFKLAAATDASAKQNPKIDYAIVDSVPEKPLPNVRGLAFDTAQSSFLAGYLAAGSTETGSVGTFGGIEIPTVTIFMDGYWEGVQYYNEQNDTDVKVLGWDEESQKGTFTQDFENKSKGQNSAQSLIAQGADVIFPVAGPAGLGGLQAAKDSGGDVKAIWVDTDGCVSAEEYCDVLLGSVVKGMDVAVTDAIADSVHDEFDNKTYVGTLENDGTDLTLGSDLEGDIDQDLKDQLEQVKEDIISGKIEITSPSSPK
ncbi:BMP family lipoprotein [Solicola gregarius]|uniref:BMP family ABC transporter substrate-binding protein n=1 Tax=Solicola gregarius TaxID=2908642 RepID=A0AA46TEW1_9ACTN|nr:BMP family ABC transporter substrate-binding protein [Solicola gregarius]UYM03955.1 BMP family ABC transporter substrate-binding protein [Solicola gregarius]